MKVFHYNARKLTEYAKFFDDRILSDSWVLFHGTSSVYEASIDREGLHPRRCQISKSEIMKVFNLFVSMNWMSEDCFGSLRAYAFPDSTDSNGDLRPICLTADPVIAAQCYSIRANAGGESIQWLLACLRALRRYLRDPKTRLRHLRQQWIDYEAPGEGRLIVVRRKWLQERLSELRPLHDRLVDIQRAHRYGVIYALRFEEEYLTHMWESGTAQFRFRGRIEPERIIAKAQIVGEVKNLQQTGRFCPSLRGDETTLLAALARLSFTRAIQNFPKGPSDPWHDAIRDPDAGIDLAISKTPDELREFLSARYPGIFEPQAIP